MNSNTQINDDVYDKELLDNLILNIGKNIRDERLKRDMLPTDLSLKANIPLSQIYKIESGKCKVGILTVIKVVIALELPIEILFSTKQKNSHAWEHLYNKNYYNILYIKYFYFFKDFKGGNHGRNY